MRALVLVKFFFPGGQPCFTYFIFLLVFNKKFEAERNEKQEAAVAKAQDAMGIWIKSQTFVMSCHKNSRM